MIPVVLEWIRRRLQPVISGVECGYVSEENRRPAEIGLGSGTEELLGTTFPAGGSP